MKIVQKRTSRFVASLFNGLGIIACVSVSSCGSKGKNSKGKETDEFDGLKKKLKEANDNFGQLDFDDQNKIAEWFKDNPSQTNFSLTKNILEQIFTDDDKFKSVAQTLGFDTSDTDDEENKKVQEWLDKLNELNLSDFNDLDSDDLKKKVAQKFIEKEIDINEDEALIANLSSVISEVKNEEETKKVTVKIEKEGKASIVYSDNTNECFEFNKLSTLQKFVDALADKNVVGVEGEMWSWVLENDKAKVCGHQDGFDYKDSFNDFLSCLNSLVKINNGFSYSGVKMTVDEKGVSLGSGKLNEAYSKQSDFWSVVKNYPALFVITNKFEIEQNGTGNNATVKINGFETELLWTDVFDEKGSTIKEEWNKIFDLKEVKGDEEDNKEKIKISYDTTNNKAKVGEQEVQVSALAVQLKGKNKDNVDIANFPQWNSFGDVNKLSSFLDYIQVLFDAGVFTKKIRITIPVDNVVDFDGVKLGCSVASVEFWRSIFDHKNLFSNTNIYISYSSLTNGIWFRILRDENSNSVKIENAFASFYSIKKPYKLIKTYNDFVVDCQTFSKKK